MGEDEGGENSQRAITVLLQGSGSVSGFTRGWRAMERGAKGLWAPGHIILVLMMLPSPSAPGFHGLTPFSWALVSHFIGEEMEVLKGKAPASGGLPAPSIRDQQSFDPR